VTYNASGTYPVRLVATNSYGSGETVKNGYITTGPVANEHVVMETLRVYPNPTRGDLTVETGEGGIENVELFDMMGRKMSLPRLSSEPDANSSIQLDLSDYPRGVYFLRINGQQTVKVIKQ
jgi:PKD repeat protein